MRRTAVDESGFWKSYQNLVPCSPDCHEIETFSDAGSSCHISNALMILFLFYFRLGAQYSEDMLIQSFNLFTHKDRLSHGERN